ncbi:hypothetical protein RUM44_006255 [Polyplax serrata]|uniref:Ig-like domain-containing protein n=1 Tax=Polyplax serrata TaxID=468196 RepID=A0ABR1AHL5_POLSC
MGVAEDFAPSFTQKPQLRQEDEGNRLVFECQLLASPKPEIHWFRGDTELFEDNRTIFKIQPIGNNKFLVALELDDVVENDAGLYKVKAKNKMGEVAASINLNFSPVDEPQEKQIDGLAPTFSKKPAIRQEEDGKKLLFECRIQADPKPTVTWFHDGVIVKNTPRHKILLDKDGHSYFGTLEIKNVTVEDAGKYKVTAKNELGESNATISLNFDSDEAPVPDDGIKPTFTERPVIRQSDDGTKITFECRCVGDPKPTITWYHGKTLVKEGGRFKMSLTLDQKLYHMARLEITNVENSDGGEYKAIAKNVHGEGVATINLNFEGGEKPKIPDGKPPRFPKKPTIRQDGETLIMECLLEANPLPDITWFQGTKTIEDSNRVRMSRKATGKDTYLLTLEISSPTKEDGGNYRCNAFNCFGESNANIALNFQGGDDEGFAPTFVDKPKIIPSDTGTLITMKCKCKAKPRPIITWYRGTTVVKESSKIKMTTVDLGEDTYEIIMEIQDPTNADGGTYKCNTKNDFGESNANLNLNIEADQEPEGKEPIFVQKPRIVSEQNGKLVIMDCSVKADPAPTIVWYHADKIVQKSSKVTITIEKKEEIYYIRLELKDPVKEDSGLYRCNIKNAYGELNANLTLNVEIVPVIKEKPKITKIIKRRTVVIECKVQSSFTPQCTWFKETKAVKEDSTHSVHIEQVKEGEFNVKLQIEQASEKDKGLYKLTVKNDKGEATSQTVELTEIPEDKEEKVQRIQIVETLRAIEVQEGQTAKFTSSIKTLDKTAKVVWYKNNSVIRESSDYKISFDGQTAILEISSVKTEFTGTYKVKFSNTVSEESSSASLKVIEKKKVEKKEKEEEEENKKVVEKKKKEEVEEKKNVVEQNEEVVEEKKKVVEKKKEELVEEKKIEEKKEPKKVGEKIVKKKDEKKEEPEMNGTTEETTVQSRKSSLIEEKKGTILRRSSVKDEPKKVVKKPEEKKPQDVQDTKDVTDDEGRSTVDKDVTSKVVEQLSVKTKRGSIVTYQEEIVGDDDEPDKIGYRKSSIQEEQKIFEKDEIRKIRRQSKDTIRIDEDEIGTGRRNSLIKIEKKLAERRDSLKETKLVSKTSSNFDEKDEEGSGPKKNDGKEPSEDGEYKSVRRLSTKHKEITEDKKTRKKEEGEVSCEDKKSERSDSIKPKEVDDHKKKSGAVEGKEKPETKMSDDLEEQKPVRRLSSKAKEEPTKAKKSEVEDICTPDKKVEEKDIGIPNKETDDKEDEKSKRRLSSKIQDTDGKKQEDRTQKVESTSQDKLSSHKKPEGVKPINELRDASETKPEDEKEPDRKLSTPSKLDDAKREASKYEEKFEVKSAKPYDSKKENNAQEHQSKPGKKPEEEKKPTRRLSTKPKAEEGEDKVEDTKRRQPDSSDDKEKPNVEPERRTRPKPEAEDNKKPEGRLSTKTKDTEEERKYENKRPQDGSEVVSKPARESRTKPDEGDIDKPEEMGRKSIKDVDKDKKEAPPDEKLKLEEYKPVRRTSIKKKETEDDKKGEVAEDKPKPERRLRPKPKDTDEDKKEKNDENDKVEEKEPSKPEYRKDSSKTEEKVSEADKKLADEDKQPEEKPAEKKVTKEPEAKKPEEKLAEKPTAKKVLSKKEPTKKPEEKLAEEAPAEKEPEKHVEKKAAVKEEPDKMKNGLSDRKPSIVEPKEPAKPESRKESLAKPDDKRRTTAKLPCRLPENERKKLNEELEGEQKIVRSESWLITAIRPGKCFKYKKGIEGMQKEAEKTDTSAMGDISPSN